MRWKKYHRDDNIVKNQTFMQGWIIITTYALSIVEVGSIQFCNNNFAIMGSVEVVLVWNSHLRRYFIQLLTWVRKLIFLLIMIIKVGRNHNKTFNCVLYIYIWTSISWFINSDQNPYTSNFACRCWVLWNYNKDMVDIIFVCRWYNN